MLMLVVVDALLCNVLSLPISPWIQLKYCSKLNPCSPATTLSSSVSPTSSQLQALRGWSLVFSIYLILPSKLLIVFYSNKYSLEQLQYEACWVTSRRPYRQACCFEEVFATSYYLDSVRCSGFTFHLSRLLLPWLLFCLSDYIYLIRTSPLVLMQTTSSVTFLPAQCDTRRYVRPLCLFGNTYLLWKIPTDKEAATGYTLPFPFPTVWAGAAVRPK